MGEPDRTNLPATLLHYRILSKLGEGGMGSVYEAEDTKLGRKVAIKTVLAKAGADAQPHRRLLNEARAASALSHPNIVTIFAVEESSGVDFIVMELVGGEPLDAVLSRGPLPVSRVLAIGADVADALDCAHESGIVHRDVKPANVLLTPRGRAKVCDFGLAKPAVHAQGSAHDPTLPITAEGVVIGTLAYMSPEQLRGEPLDARSDVFALGCLLYEAATGRRAFPQDDVLSVIRAIAIDEPAAPSSIVPGIPAGFDALVRWALAKNRSQRTASAAAVASELRALASGSQELPRSLAGSGHSRSTPRGSPFSGRTEEMASLTRLLEDAIGGRGSFVAIAGPAGAGKTRLTQEIAVTARLRGVRTLVGRCSSDEGAPPYVAFLDALSGAVARAGPAQMRARLDSSATTRLATIFPSLGEAPVSPAQATSSAAERYALFQAVTSVVRELGAESALLLVLEDVHWACLPALRLLQHVGRNLASMRVLVLATYRDDEVASDHALSTTLQELRRDGVGQRLVLRPLGSSEVRAMARAACGVDPSEGFVRALRARTDGNPLFVEEMLSHLAEDGRIRKAAEATGEKEVAALLGVPEGVREVIGHRLSRLDEKCRQALARASVIGATFRWDLLLAAADAGEDALLDAMDEALRARLVRETRGGVPAYEFTHTLVRETLYDGLGAARRARLHRRIGEALERTAQGADGQAAELALHFFHASATGGDDARKAASYGKAAAEQAMAKLAYEQAADDCTRALDRARLVSSSSADVRGLERDLYRMRGLAQACIGNWKAARTDLESALERIEDGSARADVLVQLCRVAFFCLDSSAVGRYAEQAEAAAAEIDDSHLQAEAIGWRMAAVIIDGDLERGGEHYQRGRAISGGRYVSSLGWRAIAHYWAGRFDDAIQVADDSARGAQSAGDVQTLMIVTPIQGMALASLGRYGDAARSFGEAAQLGRRYGVLSLTARSLAMSVGAQLDVFDYAGVEAAAGEAIELASSLRFTPTRFAATIDLIVAAAQRDDVARAERLLADAREMHEELRAWHDWIWNVRLLWAEAEVALAKSDWASARSLAAKMAAVQPARPKYLATARLVTSICSERDGRRDEALADAREGLRIALSMHAGSLALRAYAAVLRLEPDETMAAEARRVHAILAASFGDVRATASYRSGALRLFAAGLLEG